jgi:hypothetical protein
MNGYRWTWTAIVAADAVAFLLALAATAWPQGGCTATLGASPTPVIVGVPTTFTMSFTGTCPPPAAVTWSYTCGAAGKTGCQSGVLTQAPNGPVCNVIFPLASNYTIIANAVLSSPGSSTVLVKATKSVAVAAPNGETIFAGTYQRPPTPAGNSLDTVIYQLTSGGKPIGPGAYGRARKVVKEWIDGRWELFTTNQVQGTFYYSNGKITDNISYHGFPGFGALPDGTVLDDYYQTNYLISMDCCGNTLTFNLGTIHFNKIRWGDGWVLVVVN